jgi:hypothetical protein
MIRFIFLLPFFLFLGSCRIYNFSGANLPPDIKTVSVENFPNNSGLGPPTMSQIFTEKLRDYLQTNSSLRGVPRNGDLQFRGYISQYNLKPIAPTGSETASQTRIEIIIKVEFTNTKYEEQSFSQDFSRYADFQQSQSLASVENQLVEQILDDIVLDIFNKSLSNW